MFERFWRLLKSRPSLVECRLRRIASQIERSANVEGNEQVQGIESMIEGMIAAGEIPVAIHSLRTAIDELSNPSTEAQAEIKDLEAEFDEGIQRIVYHNKGNISE